MSTAVLTGIINLTPDSFSDGGVLQSEYAAEQKASSLFQSGAALIDIGGDSTRPGSECVGPELEWQRLEPLLRMLSGMRKFSVDTHHALVAEKALELDAFMINDVFAGRDSDMLSVLSGSKAKLVLMYSCMSSPHVFQQNPREGLLQQIELFFTERIERALQSGLKESQLVLDTGMGAFLHADPQASWELIECYGYFAKFGLELMFGASRKGFLRSPTESQAADRDALSALAAYMAFQSLQSYSHKGTVYVRAHNIEIHRQFLERLSGLELVREL